MDVAPRLISNRRTQTHTPCTAIGWFQMCATLIRFPSLRTHLSAQTTPHAEALSPPALKLRLDTDEARFALLIQK